MLIHTYAVPKVLFTCPHGPAGNHGVLLIAVGRDGFMYPPALLRRSFESCMPQVGAPEDGRLAWGKLESHLSGPLFPFWEVKDAQIVLSDGSIYLPGQVSSPSSREPFQ